MLMLNPLGGAMLMKSIGMFLGRRGSGPQSRALVGQSMAMPPRPKKDPNEMPAIALLAKKRSFRPNGPAESSAVKSSQQSRKQRKGKMNDENKKPTTNLTSGNNKAAHARLVDNLKKKTHFTRQEVESLCKVYRKLVLSATNNLNKNAVATIPTPGVPTTNRVEGLDRVVFRELIHNTFDLVTEELLIDRIFCAFDRNNDGVVKLENWVCGLSIFLKGTAEERAAFCFHVYDLNGDGFITREEMIHLLRNCLMKSPQDEDPEEGVRDLVELALRKLDIDKDGKVNYQDYLEAVTEEPLLLEAFGQCLPSDAATQTFLSTLHC